MSWNWNFMPMWWRQSRRLPSTTLLVKKIYSKIIICATACAVASVQHPLSTGSRMIDAAAKCIPNHKRVWGQMHKCFKVVTLLRWIPRLYGVIFLSSHGHSGRNFNSQAWRVYDNRFSAMCSKTVLRVTWLAMDLLGSVFEPDQVAYNDHIDALTASKLPGRKNVQVTSFCLTGSLWQGNAVVKLFG